MKVLRWRGSFGRLRKIRRGCCSVSKLCRGSGFDEREFLHAGRRTAKFKECHILEGRRVGSDTGLMGQICSGFTERLCHVDKAV